jgi:hypothetical protein
MRSDPKLADQIDQLKRAVSVVARQEFVDPSVQFGTGFFLFHDHSALFVCGDNRTILTRRQHPIDSELRKPPQ